MNKKLEKLENIPNKILDKYDRDIPSEILEEIERIELQQLEKEIIAICEYGERKRKERRDSLRQH